MGLCVLHFVLSAFTVCLASQMPKTPVRELNGIKQKINQLETEFLESLKTQKRTQGRVHKLKELIGLQKRQRKLGKDRLVQLDRYVSELERRRSTINQKIEMERSAIHRSLVDIHQSVRKTPAGPLSEEVNNAPKRRVLGKLVELRLREVEALRVDLDDSERLAGLIQNERQQLEYVVQELREQESLAEFHRQLESEIQSNVQSKRVVQLEGLQKLRRAQTEVEDLVKQLSAREELDKLRNTEKIAAGKIFLGEFPKLKGELPLPVVGKIVSSYGKSFDASAQLNVFRRGIELVPGQAGPVHAIAAGRVAFAGQLPSYGQVVILDHGSGYFSLLGRLAQTLKKVGEYVTQGQEIGVSDPQGRPVYFEIRSGNIALNPLGWVRQAPK